MSLDLSPLKPFLYANPPVPPFVDPGQYWAGRRGPCFFVVTLDGEGDAQVSLSRVDRKGLPTDGNVDAFFRLLGCEPSSEERSNVIRYFTIGEVAA